MYVLGYVNIAMNSVTVSAMLSINVVHFKPPNHLTAFLFAYRSREQAGGEPSIGQKLPDKYFVVHNNEHLRVKYIFVFGHKSRLAVGDWYSLTYHRQLDLLLP